MNDEPNKPPLPGEACCNEQPSYMTPAGAMRPKGLADADYEFARMFEDMQDDQVFLEKMRDEYEREDRCKRQSD